MPHVILDTDIGTDVDDLLALVFLAHARELFLKGVTAVCGDTLLRAGIAIIAWQHRQAGDSNHSGSDRAVLWTANLLMWARG